MSDDSPIKILTDALRPVGLKNKNWREVLREKTGYNGEKLWTKMMQLSQGEPISVQLPDGRMTMPITPTPDVQLRASIALAEMGFGKAVKQTEIVQAEQEAKEFEAVRALSDAELEAEARSILANNPIDAQFTVEPEPVKELDTWDRVFYAQVVTEQEE